MKKTLYILFCLYFITLAVIPCGDTDDCNELKHEQTSQHSEDHQEEVCTPFCVCSCCATHFLIKDFTPSFYKLATINTVYTIQKDFKISSVIIPIWQPPKLV